MAHSNESAVDRDLRDAFDSSDAIIAPANTVESTPDIKNAIQALAKKPNKDDMIKSGLYDDMKNQPGIETSLKDADNLRILAGAGRPTHDVTEGGILGCEGGLVVNIDPKINFLNSLINPTNTKGTIDTFRKEI